jgi:protein gp37
MTQLGKTSIEWVIDQDGKPGATLNPITGCNGPDGKRCRYCYAARMAARFGDVNFFPTWHPERLGALASNKPRTVFMCSMSDLFGYGVDALWTARVLHVMNQNPQHKYLCLTKRPDNVICLGEDEFPNLWLGTSVESGAPEHYRRIGQLRKVEVAHRFISFEPLLDSVDLLPHNLKGIDWVIIGAQTGPGAKPPKIEWIADIIETCAKAGVPAFIKDNAQGLAPELFSSYRALPYLERRP